MVSLDQMTKLRELLDQGWRTVPRTTTMADMKLGGPTLLRKDDNTSCSMRTASWSSRRRKRSQSG